MEHSSSLPPLDGLSAVMAAARGGSFTAAAEELGLTHGAISRRVAAVEVWLGTPLFERHGRGVRLTPAGQRFSREAERALAIIAATGDHWRPRRGTETLTLSVLPSFARLWLLPRLAALQGVPVDLRIDLRVEHRPADLEARECDLAIRYGQGSWPDLNARRLFGETLTPVAAPDLARRLGAHASADAIMREPLLHDSNTDQWRAWLAGEGVRYRPRATDRRFEDYDTVLIAAANGLGVALLRLPLAADWLTDGRLAPVSPRAVQGAQAHFAVTRVDETRASVFRLVERLEAIASGVG